MDKIILMQKNFRSINTNLIIIVFSIFSACNFNPGSYPYAEKYEINANEPELIAAIKAFKNDNPQYNVPLQTQLVDGRSDSNDFWYHFYFYNVDKNQIVYAWTRPLEKGKTTLAFVSVNEGLTLGRWKDINKDFSSAENKMQKNFFQDRILNKIIERLK